MQCVRQETTGQHTVQQKSPRLLGDGGLCGPKQTPPLLTLSLCFAQQMQYYLPSASHLPPPY